MAPFSIVDRMRLSVKAKPQSSLGAGILTQALKEFTLAFGVSPLLAIKLEVITP